MQTTLPTLYQQQIHVRHYARWNDEKGRRETWDETVDRYMQQIIRQCERQGYTLTLKERAELRDGILNLRWLPSMRAMMTAGAALEKDNVAAYNCAYMHIDRVNAFPEAMYILMCGTGVGFSCERQYVEQLPVVPEQLYDLGRTIVVEDNREGWAEAYKEFLESLYRGEICHWDTSKLRPAGARLKTFGGRSSGPGPLEELFRYTLATFGGAVGRRLNTRECHGIMCKIGEIVVSGGVRRSALISLSDPDDDLMQNAKSGKWWEDHPEFALANNSAVWPDKPDYQTFLRDQWEPLVASGSGERGIVNRKALQRKAYSTGRRDGSRVDGTNPCGEIGLRDCEFCNLTEVVARPGDEFEDLIEKVRMATILGTIQSTFTNFRFISEKWKENCEDERLLGVSITGVVDNPILNGSRGIAELKSTLHALKHVAIDTNKEWADKLGIKQSVAITCNKPSGTGSKLVYSGAGINEWHSEFFINRQRGNLVDPSTIAMVESGVPWELDVMNPTQVVFSFPLKAPEGAITRDSQTAIEKLELWKVYAENWCEHNPSTTVNVHPEEWDAVGEWCYENFDILAGVAFLPYDNDVYEQMPFEAISEDRYHVLLDEFPKDVDWSILAELENDDMTTGSRELACTSGACSLV
jgi:ribonucleoside-triphosphate reductase